MIYFRHVRKKFCSSNQKQTTIVRRCFAFAAASSLPQKLLETRLHLFVWKLARSDFLKNRPSKNPRQRVSVLPVRSRVLLFQNFDGNRSVSMADFELSEKLARRQAINDGVSNGHVWKVFNPYTEFTEFTRKEIKYYEQTFKKYDVGKDNFIDLMELKLMMEKLGAPQTHLALKEMISELDEDRDGKISFREFLLMYRKGKAGDLSDESGLGQLAALTEIDVDLAGVGRAKDFFEAKIEAQRRYKKFEEEIRAEQEEKKQCAEEQKMRRAAFKEKANFFEGAVLS